MDQEIISKEKMDYTIDLLITMAVEEIAEVTGEKPQEVIKDFLKSKTGKALYDASTNLWCNGDIPEEYKKGSTNQTLEPLPT